MNLTETTRFDTINSGVLTSGSKISWSAILAGVVVALVAQVMMTLLGLGIGIGVTNFETAGRNEAAEFGMASGIWWLVSGTIALFLGGWVAGRLSGRRQSIDGALHGMLTWALTSLLSLMLVTSTVGALISGSTQMLSRGISQISAASPEMGQVAKTAMDDAGIIQNGAASGAATQAPVKVDEQEVRQVAETASKGVSAAALWGFGILVVGMIAATLGGRQGSPPKWESDTVQTTTKD